MAWEVVVPFNVYTGGLQVRGQRVEITDQNTGMCLEGWPEILLHPEVDFQTTTFEPTSATSSENRWLVQFAHAEDATVELTHNVLCAGRMAS